MTVLTDNAFSGRELKQKQIETLEAMLERARNGEFEGVVVGGLLPGGRMQATTVAKTTDYQTVASRLFELGCHVAGLDINLFTDFLEAFKKDLKANEGRAGVPLNG